MNEEVRGMEGKGAPLTKALVEQQAGMYPADYDNDVFSDAFREPLLKRGYLALNEFIAIVGWKSPRTKGYAARNSEQQVAALTRQAFSYSDPALAAYVLTYLSGVQVRVASAILTVYDPSRYTVLDVRAWAALQKLRLLEPLDLPDLASGDSLVLDDTGLYAAYLRACTRLAGAFDVPLRTLDRCLWTLGGLTISEMAVRGFRAPMLLPPGMLKEVGSASLD